MISEKSCGAVVFLKSREVNYLLLHYEAGHWDFVKGNVEPTESEKDTVIRELQEETGIADAKFIEGMPTTFTIERTAANTLPTTVAMATSDAVTRKLVDAI